MHLDLIKIGNSRGVRLPQNIINECGFSDSVEAELIDHCLVLKAPDRPRINWENLFQSDKEEDEGSKDILSMQNSWDDKEWTW